MKRIVLVSGLVSGVILSAFGAIMLPLCLSGVIDFDRSELFGYTGMVLAFLMVFFGIRRYREEVGGGSITFGRGFSRSSMSRSPSSRCSPSASSSAWCRRRCCGDHGPVAG